MLNCPRGTDALRYPWGDEEPTAEHADFGKSWKKGKPDLVGSHPGGSGPYGAEDQAGGVWEWCADPWDEDAYQGGDGERDPVATGEAFFRVLRGGSWSVPSRDLRAAFRLGNLAGGRIQVIGFRVSCRSTRLRIKSLYPLSGTKQISWLSGLLAVFRSYFCANWRT